METVHLILISWKREDLLEKTLDSLLKETLYPFKIFLVNNGGGEQTQRILENFPKEKILAIAQYDQNVGLSIPVNFFWANFPAEFLGKIDNDMLFPKGWLSILVSRLKDNPKLGVIAQWHYSDEKIRETLRKHSFIPDQYCIVPHVGGQYLMRRKIIEEFGFIEEKTFMADWTSYQVHRILKSWHIGWVLPVQKIILLDSQNKEYQAETSSLRFRLLTKDLKSIKPKISFPNNF